MNNTASVSPASSVTPRVGNILVCSWGYDQTNIDWYEVLAVTKASVRIRKISGRVVESGLGTDTVVPVPGSGDEKDKGEVKRVNPHEGGYRVKIESYANAYLWDGKPQHATAAGYGH